MKPLLSIEVRAEHDVVLARQRARQVAGLFGFDAQDQARIASAVSEVARNAFQYASGGRLEFLVEGAGSKTLDITVRDAGPGIADLGAVLDGRIAPGDGSGQGLVGARRVMDRFEIDSAPGQGTTVRMGKTLPRRAPAPSPEAMARLVDELAKRPAGGPLEEARRQNQELIDLLGELRARQAEADALNHELEARNGELQRHQRELAFLNRELEETNKGVVALHKELDERAVSLQKASELKSRFLSNMSHEFRTPLNSIRSLAGLLLDPSEGPLHPEKQKQARFILKAAESLSELVNDLLDLAKVEAGKLDVRVEEVDVADLFATLRGTFRPLLDPSSPVALVFEDVSGLPTMRSDGGKVAQILRNFLSNALKFTDRGEVRVSARRGPGDTVVFAVSDTGIGVAPGDQERIFEEFAQVDGPVQSRVKGTGLGLPLSRKLAELLGGRVSLASVPGAGSTFSAEIPRVFGAVPDEAPHPEGGSGEVILIVDDDEIARYLVRGSLAAATDLAVIEASDGEQGLRLAREARPRAVVLDLTMQGLSGFEVLERLQSDPATRPIPVIIHSSRSLDDADRARLASASATLSKGAAPPEAAEVFREALARAGVGTRRPGEAARHD
jgi:signal transduction histidine kinase/CheY-like chemotaxis protein